MFLGRKDEKRVRELEQRVAEVRAGKRKPAYAPLAQATAKALHRAFGRIARKAASHALQKRSNKVFAQIEPFVERGSTVLDLGCGDGKVGELVSINKGSEVVLMDVIDYNKTDLPFFRYGGRDTLFPDKEFDHVLLLMVLHHCDDPIKVMTEALRMANKSVIVIESVYFNGLHKQFNKFFDWFFNKVLNDPDINVPFNFLTPSGWTLLFDRLDGRVTHMEHLGIDLLIVPEWHTLYIVEK